MSANPLPAAGDPAQARGERQEPEEGVSAVSRGAADGAQAWLPQARAWDASAYDIACPMPHSPGDISSFANGCSEVCPRLK